jgi:hypothetical protein
MCQIVAARSGGAHPGVSGPPLRYSSARPTYRQALASYRSTKLTVMGIFTETGVPSTWNGR